MRELPNAWLVNIDNTLDLKDQRPGKLVRDKKEGNGGEEECLATTEIREMYFALYQDCNEIGARKH